MSRIYSGYLSYAGMEIINAKRTITYAEAMLPTLRIMKRYDCWTLDYAVLEDTDAYQSPVLDPAPWYDADTPAIDGFLGVYPIDLKGFTDSTRTATVNESSGHGGYIGLTRHGTREMKVKAALFGISQQAAQAGLTWLRTVLDGNNCGEGCYGDDLCFFIACPDTPADGDAVARTMREVRCIEGPRVIRERSLSCGGYMIEVEFVFAAGVPYLYSEPVLVASASGAGLNTHVAGATIELLSANMPPCTGRAVAKPVYDPDCPPPPSPPTVPLIPTECDTSPPAVYKTYSVYVPGTQVKTWQDGVIQMSLSAGSKAIRQARVRLLPRALPSTAPLDLDPCTACGDFLITYIPPNGTITLDGMTERITMNVGIARATNASHLVSGVGADLFSWPLFTCGTGYYMLVEVDTNAVVDHLRLSIATRE